MATYITLLNYTEQGLKAIKESPSRLEKARQLLKSMGGDLKSFYLVQGRYDAVVACGFPPPCNDVRELPRARHDAPCGTTAA